MRLTNPLREKILSAIMSRRNQEVGKAMHERERDLANRLYRHEISEEIEKRADKLNEDVPGMCRTDANIYVTTRDSYSGYMHLGQSRPMPHGRLALHLTDEDEMFDEVVAHQRQRHDWAEETGKARESARATLAKFKTVEALKAGWPEVMPLAQPLIDAFFEAKQVKSNVPAIVPEELNAMFDLPIDDSAEKELEAA